MRQSFYFTMLLSALLACEEKPHEPRDPEPGDPISFAEVDGDISDIQINRLYAFDIHVSGSFDYSENYYYSPYHGYDFTLPYYKASYEAGSMPIMNTRVHSSLMCTYDECDSAGVIKSGVWYRYGIKPVTSSLVWKFISCDTEKGYKVTMSEFPEQIDFVDLPSVLSSASDNIINFNYNGTDSLLFGLLVVPKANIAGTNPPGLISSQHHFTIKAENNRFIIPGELIEKALVNPTDTAFINLVSLKRVIKVIDGKKIAINYRRNHIHPTIIN